MASIFAGKQQASNDFYASLAPGQVVHYHNGYGQFVRCEATVEDGETKLLPTALVGNWKTHDLPRRYPNGKVHLGFQAQRIADGETFKPNADFLYEAPGFNDRHGVDPTALAPLDITVPAMDAAEQRVAGLWQTAQAVCDALSSQNLAADPDAALAEARRILGS
jgi:hypothetical protein